MTVRSYIDARTSDIAGSVATRTLLALVVVACIWSAPNVSAQELGNPGRGQEYALNVCAECHAVLPDDTESRVHDATPFASIAATPGMTERALAAFLVTSHENMPNLVVTGEDRDNVIAYIMSLRPKK